MYNTYSNFLSLGVFHLNKLFNTFMSQAQGYSRMRRGDEYITYYLFHIFNMYTLHVHTYFLRRFNFNILPTTYFIFLICTHCTYIHTFFADLILRQSMT